jgi:hypothetical protein
MNGFRAKQLSLSFLCAILASPALAQTPPDNAQPVAVLTVPPSPDRAASFLATGEGDNAPSPSADFSGLAAAPELVAPPAAPVAAKQPVTAPPSEPAPAPSVSVDKPAPIIPDPVSVAPLPDVSNESVGTQSANSFGAAMWKGTPRPVAETLLSIATVTSSPVLNDLMRRMLVTAAVPPDGISQIGQNGTAQSLTAMRVEKLTGFGDTKEAWSLAKHADAKLIDDITMHYIGENMLAGDGEDICGLLPDLIAKRTGVDWQKDLVLCQLRAKDTKAAQVSLDVMRAQPNPDSLFLEIVDRNILGSGKTLPSQLTPLTPPLLALLRQTGIALPGDIYGHPDLALAPALLQAPAKQDVAQLGLAERAASRGIIGTNDLVAIYRTVVFPPDVLATPLNTIETGLRLHALLFRAAEAEKDTGKRIAIAIKFVQSAPPELLNGAGSIAALMLGDIKPDASLADNAVIVAQIYMLAGHGDTALAWLRIAQPTPTNMQASQALWPQFVLAGMEGDSGYAADLGNWLDAALKQSDPQTDISKARDAAASTLLFLDAAGFIVPDAVWAKVLPSSTNAKHVVFSPLLLERLQAASAGGRKAESVLLATDLAGDGDIALPSALAITRALRVAGFRAESGTFARHAVALLAKTN